MIAELLSTKGAISAFIVSLLIFGFAPGMVLAAIVRVIPNSDRRCELQAELYEVPRWERPYWVAQQLEVALRIGLTPQMEWYWGRHVWHRCKLQSGLAQHTRFPDSFYHPSQDLKDEVHPGDSVKLAWSVRRLPGERMWVVVTHRDGDRLVGTLENHPVFVCKDPDETIKFHIDDIIDCILVDDAPSAPAVSSAM